MRFWRARIKHVELLSQPPSPSNTSCIEQDWISEVHVFLDEASDPQIVSLHHVKVHDWSYVGTRNSLHTSDLLARVQGKLQALMVPFEPEEKPKTASEKLQDLAKQLATDPKPSIPPLATPLWQLLTAPPHLARAYEMAKSRVRASVRAQASGTLWLRVEGSPLGLWLRVES